MRIALRSSLCLLALLGAAGVWFPTLHLFFATDVTPLFAADGPLPARVRALAARHVGLWEDAALRRREQGAMRRSNAEWDFMGRTFLVLALADIALRDPAERARSLAVVDRIVEDTIAAEQAGGTTHFLMGYARHGRFVQQPAHSLFVDGELALMLGARRLVAEEPRYREPFAERVTRMAQRMAEAPLHCSESYPDECWMFCNAVAMVAMRMSEVLDATDHSALRDAWLSTIKERLRHAETGLLVSSFRYDGEPTNGPEGSSIWFVIHCLRVLDPSFARDQYERARNELGRILCGFGYAREWPSSWVGPVDVDAGAVIPFLEISAGSSGMAFLAARGMDDRRYLQALLATMELAGFPEERNGKLRYSASNQVGDAVLLYSLVQGPLWTRLGGRR